MSIVITGGAGFIGVNLAAMLVHRGERVYLLDNFCRGSLENISFLRLRNQVEVRRVDIDNYETLWRVVSEISHDGKIDEIWHLAANSDIPAGIADRDVDFRDTFLTTHNVLKVIDALDIGTMVFASTSAVYGDLGDAVLHETIGPLLPISNYGAMKLASEASISAAIEAGLKKAIILRFPNVIGTPSTHGVISDFVDRLKLNGDELRVLGDGSQRKAYLHVTDLIDAMLYIRDMSTPGINLFNVGPKDRGVYVKTIAEEVVRQYRPTAKILYGSEKRGWIGDVPKFTYSTDKLVKAGWVPSMSSEEAIKLAVKQIIAERG